MNEYRNSDNNKVDCEEKHSEVFCDSHASF